MADAAQAELERALRASLDRSLDDDALLAELEALGRKDRFHFGALTHEWGPRLYQRNRASFRSFILQNFAYSKRWDSGLTAWLEAADRDGEVELFRNLYRWAGIKHWKEDLLERVRRAADEKARSRELDKLEHLGFLDEAAALELYAIDRSTAAFIPRHVPFRDKPWRKLWAQAQGNGDEALYLALYRAQVPFEEWEKDALALAKQSEDPVAELEKRHPAWPPPKIGGTFLKLLELGGEALLPYVQRHLFQIRGDRSHTKALAALALKRGWLDLWSNLERTCTTHDDYVKTLKQVCASEPALVPLLGGSFYSLDDELALMIYRRSPELLRGPFKSQLHAHCDYGKLLAHLEQVNDEELLDLIASRLMIAHPYTDHQRAAVQRFTAQFQSMHDELERARRAARVIGLVPAHAIWNVGTLVKNNSLARLLLMRSSASYLADPSSVRDLLESPSIHAQMLAFRALASSDPRAPSIGAANLDLLLAAFLRKLHRSTRRLAFAALERAAVDLEAARRIRDKAVDAFDLPDKRYPKEDLIGLLGSVLHRFPELRSAREQPVIHRRAAP